MNGFGHFAAPLLWYRTYWALVSLCLIVVAAVLWPRGTTEGLMRRIRTLPARAIHERVRCSSSRCWQLSSARASSSTTLGFSTAPRVRAGWRPCEPLTSAGTGRFQRIPQPVVEAVDLSGDFFPRRRRLHLRGTMTLRNVTGGPVDTLHVTLLPARLAAPARLELDRPTSPRTVRDAEHGYTIFALATPLAAGSTATLRYDYEIAARGFSEDVHLGAKPARRRPATPPSGGSTLAAPITTADSA